MANLGFDKLLKKSLMKCWNVIVQMKNEHWESYQNFSKLTDKQTDTHLDKHAERHTDRHTDGQTRRQIDRHKQTDRQTDTERKTDRQTCTDTKTDRPRHSLSWKVERSHSALLFPINKETKL